MPLSYRRPTSIRPSKLQEHDELSDLRTRLRLRRKTVSRLPRGKKARIRRHRHATAAGSRRRGPGVPQLDALAQAQPVAARCSAARYQAGRILGTPGAERRCISSQVAVRRCCVGGRAACRRIFHPAPGRRKKNGSRDSAFGGGASSRSCANAFETSKRRNCAGNALGGSAADIIFDIACAVACDHTGLRGGSALSKNGSAEAKRAHAPCATRRCGDCAGACSCASTRRRGAAASTGRARSAASRSLAAPQRRACALPA